MTGEDGSIGTGTASRNEAGDSQDALGMENVDQRRPIDVEDRRTRESIRAALRFAVCNSPKIED